MAHTVSPPLRTSRDDLIAEWTDEPKTQPETPKLWRDMTPEEKGALLLAHHEGKAIEWWTGGTNWRHCHDPEWQPDCAYRVRPEPKRETVTQYWERDRNNCHFIKRQGDTHGITFDLIDGKPTPGTYTDDKGNIIRIEEI